MIPVDVVSCLKRGKNTSYVLDSLTEIPIYITSARALVVVLVQQLVSYVCVSVCPGDNFERSELCVVIYPT